MTFDFYVRQLSRISPGFSAFCALLVFTVECGALLGAFFAFAAGASVAAILIAMLFDSGENEACFR